MNCYHSVLSSLFFLVKSLSAKGGGASPPPPPPISFPPFDDPLPYFPPIENIDRDISLLEAIIVLILFVIIAAIAFFIEKKRREARQQELICLPPLPLPIGNLYQAPPSYSNGEEEALVEEAQPPPAYDTPSTSNPFGLSYWEPTNKYAKYDEANKELFLAASEFIKNNPIAPPVPSELLPSWTTYSFAQSHTRMIGVGLFDEGRRLKFNRAQDTCLQTPYPIPFDIEQTYWFYVKIEKLNAGANCAIGLATRPFPNFRLPGWEPISIGYHSDDGRKFINDPYGGRDYAEPFGEGDVIGLGYCPKSGTVFYTKNSKGFGAAELGLGIGQSLYPTIGMDGPGEVTVSFAESPWFIKKDVSMGSHASV